MRELLGWYEQQDEFDRSLKIENSLLDRFDYIAEYSETYPTIKKVGNKDIRKCLHERKIDVFYESMEDSIIILRIWHTARNPRRLKF
jgi:plasmid stabilization system protein ParE